MRGHPCPTHALQVEDEDEEFVEEFLSEADPSILHFLLASGECARACLHACKRWCVWSVGRFISGDDWVDAGICPSSTSFQPAASVRVHASAGASALCAICNWG